MLNLETNIKRIIQIGSYPTIVIKFNIYFDSKF